MLVSGVALAQPMGGVRRHAQQVLPRAARLLEEGGGALALLEGREGVQVELPPSVERFPSDVPARPALLRAALEGKALRRALRTSRARGAGFDLVHVAHLPAPRSLGVPWVLLLHDLKALAPRAPLARRLAGPIVLARAVQSAAAVVAVSEALAREIRERFDVGPDDLHVAPNGCDHLPVLPRESPRDAFLLCVAHVEPRKNLEVAVRALAADRGLPPLAVAGAPRGGEARRLLALARRLGVVQRLRLLGEQGDAALAALYARAACVILPSRREGFGIPALEAQRALAPLAIARIPALVEVAGESTPSFDPDDAAGCARAVRAAIEAPPSERGRAAARAAGFTWDRSARRLVEVWEHAATRARARA